MLPKPYMYCSGRWNNLNFLIETISTAFQELSPSTTPYRGIIAIGVSQPLKGDRIHAVYVQHNEMHFVTHVFYDDAF